MTIVFLLACLFKSLTSSMSNTAIVLVIPVLVDSAKISWAMSACNPLCCRKSCWEKEIFRSNLLIHGFFCLCLSVMFNLVWPLFSYSLCVYEFYRLSIHTHTYTGALLVALKELWDIKQLSGNTVWGWQFVFESFRELQSAFFCSVRRMKSEKNTLNVLLWCYKLYS